MTSTSTTTLPPAPKTKEPLPIRPESKRLIETTWNQISAMTEEELCDFHSKLETAKFDASGTTRHAEWEAVRQALYSVNSYIATRYKVLVLTNTFRSRSTESES